MDLNDVETVEQDKVTSASINLEKEVKNVSVSNEPIPEGPLKINRDKFKILAECIGLMPTLACTDCNIKNGFIRQPDNYGNAIIELDLTSILDSRSLSISNAKEKYSIMKALDIDDSVEWSKEDILLTEFDKGYKIMDKISTVSFKKPVETLMENIFISKDQLDSKADTNEKNIIFTLVVNPMMIKRIKSMCDSMGTDIITIEMKDKKASLFVHNKNNTDEMSAKVIADFDLLESVPEANFSFSSLPFRVSTSTDLLIKLYKQPKNCLIFFEQKIFETINFRIYMLTRISGS